MQEGRNISRWVDSVYHTSDLTNIVFLEMNYTE